MIIDHLYLNVTTNCYHDSSASMWLGWWRENCAILRMPSHACIKGIKLVNDSVAIAYIYIYLVVVVVVVLFWWLLFNLLFINQIIDFTHTNTNDDDHQTNVHIPLSAHTKRDISSSSNSNSNSIWTTSAVQIITDYHLSIAAMTDRIDTVVVVLVAAAVLVALNHHVHHHHNQPSSPSVVTVCQVVLEENVLSTNTTITTIFSSLDNLLSTFVLTTIISAKFV